MLARQALLRRAVPSVATTPRLLGCHARPAVRQLSFLPWRQSKPSSALPVYFAKPPTAARGPGLRRRIGKMIVTTVILYSCWQIFATVVFDPLLDWADSEWEAMSDKEKEEVHNMAEEDEPLLFLPFPFTTKEVKQPFYKGSDPEWATFVQVNKDTKLQKEIRTGLAEEIKRGVDKNPGLVRLLGGGIKVRKYWLDIIYPPAPPPKHYVAGVIIDEDGIFWGDRPIDSTAASYLDKAIYPKAVALTAWTFVNFLLKQTAQDIATALGLNSSPAPEATWQSVTLDRIKDQGNIGGVGTSKPRVKVTFNHEKDKPQTWSIPSSNPSILGTLFGSDTKLDPRIQAAVQAASMTFARNWKPTKKPPTRGCILVDGVIELTGNAACMAVYVHGWYDPKLRKFVGIHTGLKHLIKLKQRPAPG